MTDDPHNPASWSADQAPIRKEKEYNSDADEEQRRRAESTPAPLESATPRTDAFAKSVHEGQCLPTCDRFAHDEKCPVCFGEYLMADFARTLERELAEVKALAQSNYELATNLCDELNELKSRMTSANAIIETITREKQEKHCELMKWQSLWDLFPYIENHYYERLRHFVREAIKERDTLRQKFADANDQAVGLAMELTGVKKERDLFIADLNEIATGCGVGHPDRNEAKRRIIAIKAARDAALTEVEGANRVISSLSETLQKAAAALPSTPLDLAALPSCVETLRSDLDRERQTVAGLRAGATAVLTVIREGLNWDALPPAAGTPTARLMMACRELQAALSSTPSTPAVTMAETRRVLENCERAIIDALDRTRGFASSEADIWSTPGLDESLTAIRNLLKKLEEKQ